jgi:Flp pilus assembly protein TadG
MDGLPSHARARPSQRGQVLPLFAVGMATMVLMATLLFDGAQALVVRRRLQSAADAAAMAAANTLLADSIEGCSAGTGATPKEPVRQAAMAALEANSRGLDIDTVEVECALGYGTHAVRVTLEADSPSFFMGGMHVSASGTALNGQVSTGKYSVIELNPYNPSWSKNNGCPSVLFSGGPSVLFEGSLQANSGCPAGSGGAMGTNGNAATVTFTNGADARLVGGFVQGPLVITPPPRTNQPAVADPLRALPPPEGLPVRSTSRLVLNNESLVLDPGVYLGGIQLKNKSQAYLHPGIYVLDGGGLDLGAQAAMFSIDSSRTTTSIETWARDCTSACGVLLHNTGTASTFGPISVGAGATLLLKPYQPRISAPSVSAYMNLLIWQSLTPVTTSSWSQPPITLNGGGKVDVSGTIYAPSAQVYLTGGSGGSGGSTVDLTLQFISWDLQIQGNSRFNFYYRSEAFAKPFAYGLVE